MPDDLQTLCVKRVAANFENYNFKATTNRLGPSVQLLQKLYSDQVLQLMAEQRILRKDHLTFLINKYTRQINIQYLLDCDFHAIEERLQEIGSGITIFCMPNVRKFYNSENLLRHLTNIEILDLSGSNCSDYILGIVSENCSRLKKLFLRGCERVSDKGLLQLCEANPPLESLNVENTFVTYKGVAFVLKCIPSLLELWFNDVPRAICEASGIHDLADSSNGLMFPLQNLAVLNNPLRPKNHLIAISRLCAMSCPMVRDLVMSEIVAKEQLDLCCTFPNLENVSLQCSKIVNLNLCINHFIAMRGENLRSLTLISFTVSVELLAKHCHNLESLCLENPIFEDIQNSSVTFPCLIRLSLQNVNLDLNRNWSPASIISSSPCLKELHVVNCEMTSEMQDLILHNMPKLQFLNLSSTLVSFEFVEAILHMHTALEKLIIDNSGISSTEYDDLLDLVDEMMSKVDIVWADYSEAIRELFYMDYDLVFNDPHKRMILKL